MNSIASLLLVIIKNIYDNKDICNMKIVIVSARIPFGCRMFGSWACGAYGRKSGRRSQKCIQEKEAGVKKCLHATLCRLALHLCYKKWLFMIKYLGTLELAHLVSCKHYKSEYVLETGLPRELFNISVPWYIKLSMDLAGLHPSSYWVCG